MFSPSNLIQKGRSPSTVVQDIQNVSKVGEDSSQIEASERRTFLMSVPLLQTLPPADFEALCKLALEKHYTDGSVIVREGEPGENFFVIYSGSVRVMKRDTADPRQQHVLTRLSTGDYFGERALIMDKPRAATVIADTDVLCLCVDRQTFDEVLSSVHHLVGDYEALYNTSNTEVNCF